MSALKVSSEPSRQSSWRNDILSLAKKCRILALYVECLTREGGTEFTLTAALYLWNQITQCITFQDSCKTTLL
jgi:hypothetical protein